jgi:hypothetical protein
MRQFRANTQILRLIAAVLLAVSLQACTRWSLVPEPKSLTSNPRGTVRVTLVGDASRLVVKHPTIAGDSLVWNNPERRGVPLSKIAWLEARSLDPVATGFFALVGIAFLGAVVLRQ